MIKISLRSKVFVRTHSQSIFIHWNNDQTRRQSTRRQINIHLYSKL